MSEPPAKGTPKSWCGACGFPLAAPPRCPACGQTARSPAPAAAAKPAPAALEEPDDTPPELAPTLNYLQIRNYAYYIPNVLSKLGGVSMPADHPDGRFWTIVLERPPNRRVAVMAGLEARQIFVAEAAVVEIVADVQAPVMRAALELNEHLNRGIRLALRDQTLVLRYTGAIAIMKPMRIVEILFSMADMTGDLEAFFITRFSCRPYALPMLPVRGASGYDCPPRKPALKIAIDAGGMR